MNLLRTVVPHHHQLNPHRLKISNDLLNFASYFFYQNYTPAHILPTTNDHKHTTKSSSAITTDFRPLTSHTAQPSAWASTLRRCTNPVQLRITISRIFSHTPVHVDILAALNACARIAIFGSGGATAKVQHFQQQGFECAQSIMHAVTAHKIVPSVSIYAAYIRVCANANQPDAAFLALHDLKRNGLTPDLDVFKGLIMAAARHGDLRNAMFTIESSVSHTNSLVRHANKLKVALRFVVGLEIGKFVGVCISVYTGIDQLHAQILGLGFGLVFGVRLIIPILIKMNAPSYSDKALDTSVLTSAKFQQTSQQSFHLLDADQVNEHMHYFLIDLLEQSGNVDGIIQVISEMKQNGLTIPPKTYHSLVSELVLADKPELALETIQCLSNDTSQFVSPTSSMYAPILQYYYDRGLFKDTVSVYEKYMALLPLDKWVYTTLISAYGKVNNVDQAMLLFDQFLKLGFIPNHFILNTLISILAMNGKYRLAEEVVLSTMAKYSVFPSLRSYCKLIEKARSINRGYEPPPLSTQFTPPVLSIPSTLGYNFPTRLPRDSVPIQVERAWYWYHRSLQSGLIDSYIPVSFLLLVLGNFGYGQVALIEYAKSLRPPSQTKACPRISLLLPNPSPFKSGPLRLTYWSAIRSAALSPSIQIESAVAMLYESKSRHAWPFPLPNPSSCPSLIPLISYIESQRHLDQALALRENRDPTFPQIAHQSNSVLSALVHRCLIDRDNVAVEVQLIVSNITHSFLLSIFKKLGTASPSATLSTGTRGHNTPIKGAVGMHPGPSSSLNLLNEDEDDEEFTISNSSTPFKPVRTLWFPRVRSKTPPIPSPTSHNAQHVSAQEFMGLKANLKRLDCQIETGRFNKIRGHCSHSSLD